MGEQHPGMGHAAMPRNDILMTWTAFTAGWPQLPAMADPNRDMRALVAMMKFERITVDPTVCTGKSYIRGLRFPVSRLLSFTRSSRLMSVRMVASVHRQNSCW